MIGARNSGEARVVRLDGHVVVLLPVDDRYSRSRRVELALLPYGLGAPRELSRHLLRSTFQEGTPMPRTYLVAGATGDIGRRIVRELRALDADVRVLTRPGGSAAPFAGDDGVHVVRADYTDREALQVAVEGVDVVISAVSGARPVIVDAQRALLAAAVAAGVPRFIPSDYSADYRRITPGSNRNFELRREFQADVDAAPIRASSVLVGAFTDMLTGQAPLVVPKLKRVLFWSDPDQVLDFTTKDDTARVTARVALDDDAPRFVEVAGDRVTARGLARSMTRITGETYRVQWAGTTGTLAGMARVMRARDSDSTSAFPAWQGMQYMVSMYSGQAEMKHVDNDRFGTVTWTTAEDVLAGHFGR
jgi:uncharacterized protein YbjT (DUF2867 family)